MKHIQAPHTVSDYAKTLFLAGSIEMGRAEQWQQSVVELLKESDWTILNPRRNDWDSSWKQDIHFKPFNEQVTWELEGLEKCEKAIVYFAPETQAPITLLELGLLSQIKKPKNLLVVCPDGFYRKGNVDIVCDRYGIQQYATLEDACRTLMKFEEGSSM